MPASAEHDALIGSYEHLTSMSRAADALHTIRKIASLVKPIMRKRGWHVRILSEFYPDQQNLLGINVNMGYKICLRLRYPGDKDQFLPTEQVIDTMLHELSHNIFGPHDEKFHALWDELRDEYTELTIKGFTGEGFLSDGQRLGGRNIPIQEMRRQARVAAQQRRIRSQGSGQKLGGAPVMHGVDMRQVIADAAARRMRITTGCASNDHNAEALGDEASANGFRTQAEENDANDRAIAQALWELVQEEEARRAGVTDWRNQGLVWNPNTGLEPAELSKEFDPGEPPVKPKISKPLSTTKMDLPPFEKLPKPARGRTLSGTRSSPPTKTKRSKLEQSSFAEPIDLTDTSSASLPRLSTTWSCNVCTLVNPINLDNCDACEESRPAEITALSSTKLLPKAGPHNPKSTISTSKLLKSSNKSTSLISAAEAEARARLKPKAGWTCTRCGNWMEATFWSCQRCGNIKEKS